MNNNKVNQNSLFLYSDYIKMLKYIFNEDGTTVGGAFLYKNKSGSDTTIDKNYISQIINGKRGIPEKLLLDETLDNLLDFAESTYSENVYVKKIEDYISKYNLNELIKKSCEKDQGTQKVKYTQLKHILKALYNIARNNRKNSSSNKKEEISDDIKVDNNNFKKNDIHKFNLIKASLNDFKKRLINDLPIKIIEENLVELMDEITLYINGVSFNDEYLNKTTNELSKNIDNFNFFLATKFHQNPNTSHFILNKNSILSLNDFKNEVKSRRERIIHLINTLYEYSKTYESSID